MRCLQTLVCLLVLLENFVKILRAEQETALDARAESGQPLLESPLILNAQTCVQQDDGQIKQADRLTINASFAQLVNGQIKQADRLTINASFAPLEDGLLQLGLQPLTIVKDVAQLGNGRIKQADRLTINASFAPLEDGQRRLGSPLMLNAQTCVQQEDGLLPQV